MCGQLQRTVLEGFPMLLPQGHLSERFIPETQTLEALASQKLGQSDYQGWTDAIGSEIWGFSENDFYGADGSQGKPENENLCK